MIWKLKPKKGCTISVFQLWVGKDVLIKSLEKPS